LLLGARWREHCDGSIRPVTAVSDRWNCQNDFRTVLSARVNCTLLKAGVNWVGFSYPHLYKQVWVRFRFSRDPHPCGPVQKNWAQPKAALVPAHWHRARRRRTRCVDMVSPKHTRKLQVPKGHTLYSNLFIFRPLNFSQHIQCVTKVF